MTLCKDFECPLRNSCARYLKTTGSEDIFFESSPRKYGSTKCVEFYPWIDYNRENLVVKRKEPTDARRRTTSSFRPYLR